MDDFLANIVGHAGTISLMAGRRLSDTEKTIWQRVARTVRPLSEGAGKGTVGEDSYVHLPPDDISAPRSRSAQTDLTPRQDKIVRKGKVQINAKIDLHDLTRDEAYLKLVRRIERAFERQERTVLVVTGKGANLEGVLRNNLVGWLSTPKLRPFIAGYAQAHIRHGGTGAFYVFLKREIR